MTFNVGDGVRIYRSNLGSHAWLFVGRSGTITEVRSPLSITVTLKSGLKLVVSAAEIEKDESMDKVKYTFPNGVIAEGTLAQIQAIGKALGFAVNIKMYRSATHGLIPIASMDDTHLKNAILARYRVWANDLSGVKGARELISALRNGPSDEEFLNLMTEYVTRVTNGRIK